MTIIFHTKGIGYPNDSYSFYCEHLCRARSHVAMIDDGLSVKDFKGSNPLFPPGIQNSCSLPSLVHPSPKQQSFLPPLIHPKPIFFKFPANLPESPCSVHLVFPVLYPSPSLSLQQISSCLCSPLFSASLS